jgi:hypothetical protein
MGHLRRGQPEAIGASAAFAALGPHAPCTEQHGLAGALPNTAVRLVFRRVPSLAQGRKISICGS